MMTGSAASVPAALMGTDTGGFHHAHSQLLQKRDGQGALRQNDLTEMNLVLTQKLGNICVREK
jgi:hypothetical protein